VYAGEYDGNRRLFVANNKLMYEAPIGGLAEALVPLSDSVFVTSSQSRLAFERDGRGVIAALRVRGTDERLSLYPKKSDAPAPE
jgi:hypothetical protein